MQMDCKVWLSHRYYLPEKTPRLERFPDPAMQSTALPSLGCGNGNLPWKYVREGVIRTFETPGSCICSSMEPKKAAAGYAAVGTRASPDFIPLTRLRNFTPCGIIEGSASSLVASTI